MIKYLYTYTEKVLRTSLKTSLYAIELGLLPLANLLKLRAKSIITSINKTRIPQGLELDNDYININLDNKKELREAINRLDVKNLGPGSNIPFKYSSDRLEITFKENIRLLIAISKKSIRKAHAEAKEIFENSIIEVIKKLLLYNNIRLEAI
ncbi:uncharacterized protein RCO7_10226 [Rhynchosporium graminicola]|uniref:Uncharacterized protein n=1 Tax=Rhynchosporium graminicola TaxID=2792576 RepID=A0A1E1LUY4_9HELO|nr:uncharacterized protein RCO7_10226 [Rhynchosporium commune]